MLAAPAARAEMVQCVAAVALEGDPEQVAAVRQVLAQRGIGEHGAVGCQPVRVMVVAHASELRVRVEDPWGRSAERVVAQPETAAVFIESWVRADLTAPLLRAEEPTRSAAPAAVPKDRSTGRSATPKGAEERAAQRPAEIGFAAETSVGFDRSLWLGASADGCIGIGPLCAGALVRAAVDLGESGGSDQFDSNRVCADVLVGVTLPLRLGRMTVLPGVGMGVGWLRSWREHYDPDEPDDGEEDVDAGGLRVEARVGLAVPIAAGIALYTALSAGVSPVAHRSPFDEEGVVLAGEPGGYVRAGVGLRFGEP